MPDFDRTEPHDFSALRDRGWPEAGENTDHRRERQSYLPASSRWIVALAVLFGIALVAGAVLLTLLVQARHNLVLTKGNLNQTRSLQSSTAGTVDRLRQELTTTKGTLADLQARLDQATSQLAAARRDMKQKDAVAEDLQTCIKGYIEAERARGNAEPGTEDQAANQALVPYADSCDQVQRLVGR